MKNKLLTILSGIFLISLVSAQNVDIVESAGGLFGGFSLGTAWSLISYGILGVVIAGVVIFFGQQYLYKKKFNKTITFWRKNPLTGLTVADKNIPAMVVRLDSFGNLGYRLKYPYETKNLIPKLRIETKPNQHYVEYCEDGRIVEIGGVIGFDEQRKAMKMSFTDSNTELARSSMHQMNKERYEKKSFWTAENIQLMTNIGAIVVIMVFLWLIADKMIDIVSSVSGVVQEAGKLQEAQSNILDSLRNLLNSQGVQNLSPQT